VKKILRRGKNRPTISEIDAEVSVKSYSYKKAKQMGLIYEGFGIFTDPKTKAIKAYSMKKGTSLGLVQEAGFTGKAKETKNGVRGPDTEGGEARYYYQDDEKNVHMVRSSTAKSNNYKKLDSKGVKKHLASGSDTHQSDHENYSDDDTSPDKFHDGELKHSKEKGTKKVSSKKEKPKKKRMPKPPMDIDPKDLDKDDPYYEDPDAFPDEEYVYDPNKDYQKETSLDIHNWDQKGEVMNEIFGGGKENYSTLQGVKDVHSGKTKDIEVRMPVDPKTGKKLDIRDPKQRKRTIEVIDSLLKNAKAKAVHGINLMKEPEAREMHGDPVDTTKIHKWLGDVGELYAYQETLKSGLNPYMLTDSARKNDMVITSTAKGTRQLHAFQQSIKTVEGGTHLNKMGASAKADVDAAFNNAENSVMEIKGVGKVEGSTVANSTFELRKAIIKHMSAGKVFQDKDRKSKIKVGGKTYQLAEWERKATVTPDIIKSVLGNDDLFSNPNKSPIRGINDEPLDPKQINAMRKYFAKQLSSNKNMKVADLQNWCDKNITDAMKKTGATFKPATDVLGTAWEQGKGFTGNTVITMESQEEKFKEKMKVDDISQISPEDQLKYVLGMRYTGRGMGNKKAGTGYFDGQQFGTPNKDLAADPIPYEEYLNGLKG
jgi:hypothetical protein